MVNWIIDNHDRKTRGRQFGAIMAVGSVDGLIEYYEAFERARQTGRHDLKIATIFTYAANDADPDADGLLPDTNFPDGAPATAQLPFPDDAQAYQARQLVQAQA